MPCLTLWLTVSAVCMFHLHCFLFFSGWVEHLPSFVCKCSSKLLWFSYFSQPSHSFVCRTPPFLLGHPPIFKILLCKCSSKMGGFDVSQTICCLVQAARSCWACCMTHRPLNSKMPSPAATSYGRVATGRWGTLALRLRDVVFVNQNLNDILVHLFNLQKSCLVHLGL